MTISPEQLRHIVQAAGLAPSVHNTQPWSFVASPDGLELHADVTRQLPVLDAQGRQLHLSCGGALLHARVAARAIGIDVDARLLPDPTRPGLLADLVLTRGTPGTQDEVALATAILHRHTFRGAFDDAPVAPALVDRLRKAAELEGAVLKEVSRSQDLMELAVLLSHTDTDEEHDAAYRAELQQWLRADAPDGLPAAALADVAPGSTLRQRDFTLTHPAGTNGSAPDADRPLVLVLGTETDDERAWLMAGQALSALLLRAADVDVQAQPLGQVTDSSASRRRLRTALGLVCMPQLVLRMGRATTACARTPRRAVEDVLTTATP